MFLPSSKFPAAVIVALLVAASLVVRHRIVSKQRLHPLDFAWLLPALAACVATIAWVHGGLYESGSDGLAIVLVSLAALAEGTCALVRRPVLDALDVDPEAGRAARVRGEAIRAGIAVVALLASCVLGWIALELPWNPNLLQIEPLYSMIELLIILGALVLLYLVGQRRGAGMAVGVGVLTIVGIAQFFVARFKSSAIMPGDLLALGTAAEVSGGYTYSVDRSVILAIACALVAVGLCAFVAPSRPRSREGVFGNVMGNVVATLIVGCLFWSGVTMDYGRAFGMWVDYWDSVTSYQKHGFLPSFVKVLQDLPIKQPESYSDAEAAELEASYAAAYDAGEGSSERRAAAEQQFDETKPSIVCIMDESFSDLSFLDGLRSGYEGPEFYSNWQDTLLRGDLGVSVQGGGTCNTEFEFLTGVPLASVGSGKYPYTLYSLAEAPSIAKQLSALGYETTAIHPNAATNWNRLKVYEDLGFDEFIDFEDFGENPGWLHSGVSDEGTFNKVLEVLGESDDPQFIFAITMQNHSSYTQNDIPAEWLRNYTPEGLDEQTTAELNEYLGCIDASDHALEQLVAQLSELDRPVVLVFFGDHQPNFTPTIVDTFYPEQDNLSRTVKKYQATYAVWTNYEVAGSAAEGQSDDAPAQAGGYTGPAYLAAMTLDAVGGPLTEYQKALLTARSELTCVSLFGMRLADGTWVASDGSSGTIPSSYADLSKITYLEFARKVE